MASLLQQKLIFPESPVCQSDQFAISFRIDRTNRRRNIRLYDPDEIPAKLPNNFYVSSDTDYLAIEIDLRRIKWVLIYSGI